jgi:hypothetical protein
MCRHNWGENGEEPLLRESSPSWMKRTVLDQLSATPATAWLERVAVLLNRIHGHCSGSDLVSDSSLLFRFWKII